MSVGTERCVQNNWQAQCAAGKWVNGREVGGDRAAPPSFVRQQKFTNIGHRHLQTRTGLGWRFCRSIMLTLSNPSKRIHLPRLWRTELQRSSVPMVTSCTFARHRMKLIFGRRRLQAIGAVAVMQRRALQTDIYIIVKDEHETKSDWGLSIGHTRG